ncbi:hypothetical protein DENSPDRAFT_814085 [Dentipellis sp. KUC8613]|nr:hypothetical protein DENSPDRAFT_814085 [Dentipellis sp. KUC8613]
MGFSLFKDPEATHKLLEYVLDSPGGRRSLGRLARTCKAFCEPALNLLWKELDSLMPLISLFPNHLFKRARRPGLGLAVMPLEEDWDRILAYGQRVRRLTYDESSKAISPSIFPVLEEYRPRTYILPFLTTLVWRAESPAGLDRSQLFLSPDLQSLVLEIGTRFPQLNTFFNDLALRTRLTSLSFTSPTSLPDDFPRLLRSQDALERVSLIAPGALSSSIGHWTSSLPHLRSLQIDLTGRSAIAVEGFFDDILANSGNSSPTTPDSGVFSSEDIDFTEVKKSTLRLTGDRVADKGAFAELRHLHLTGEVSNIVVFLGHLSSPVAHLELVVEDPMDKADWHDLCQLLCQHLADSLQSIRITASGASRFNDLVRTTSRGAEISSRRLALDALTYLPRLARLEIDLPESVIFHNSDLFRVGEACPNLEVLRLCPVARFPISMGPPSLTLEGIAYLTSRCRRLHTLAVVVDGKGGSHEVFTDPTLSSRSLFRLHVGHSWIRDPLAAAILLSHLVPYVESFKWFHEKNRPGYIETHALNWAQVAEMLPHLQAVRLVERQAAARNVPDLPVMVHKSVDATVPTRNRGVSAVAEMVDSGVQIAPQMVTRYVEARPTCFEVEIDATPAVLSEEVDAVPSVCEESVDAVPVLVSQEVSAVISTISKSVDAVTSPEPRKSLLPMPTLYVPSVVSGAVNLAWRAMLFGPNFMTARMHDIWTMTPFHAYRTYAQQQQQEKVANGTETEKPEGGNDLNGRFSPVCI